MTCMIIALFTTVVAGAVVFLERACRAFIQVGIELFAHRLGIRSSFDRNDSRKVIPLGESVGGDEHPVLFFHFQLGRIGTLTTDDADFLIGDGNHFSIVIDEGDLGFAIFCYEEFGVGFDCHDHPSVVRAGKRVFGVLTFRVFFVIVTLFLR